MQYVWLFYIRNRSNKTLRFYAWTADKALKEMFLNQRNKQCFVVLKMKYKALSNYYLDNLYNEYGRDYLELRETNMGIGDFELHPYIVHTHTQTNLYNDEEQHKLFCSNIIESKLHPQQSVLQFKVMECLIRDEDEDVYVGHWYPRIRACEILQDHLPSYIKERIVESELVDVVQPIYFIHIDVWGLIKQYYRHTFELCTEEGLQDWSIYASAYYYSDDTALDNLMQVTDDTTLTDAIPDCKVVHYG